MNANELEKYKPREDANDAVGRRNFLKRLGGGLIIVFGAGDFSLLNAAEDLSEVDFPEFNGYLRIREDGFVDCFTGKIEMGQGINTSLPQALAEELEVDVFKVNMVMGDTLLCPFDAGTWGSLTTRFHDKLIREAAAEARIVLLDLASERMGVPSDRLMARNGVIYMVSDESRRIAYTELTKGEKIVRGLTVKPGLKGPDELKIVGKSFHRRDSVEKVTGKALFTADISLPGMLQARILRPPALRSKLVSVDLSGAEALPGVKILREEDFIAVLHPDFEKAGEALAAIKANWEVPEPLADDETIFAHILKNADRTRVRFSDGDLETGKRESEILVSEEYHDGYKAHAPIETHAATAVFEKGKLTMWASAQSPFGTQRNVSELLKIPKEQVHLKQVLLGGGFGGKIYSQQAEEAARIAKMLEGTPVQLIWTRKEEFMYDRFRSAAVIKVDTGITRDGLIRYFDFNIFNAENRGTILFYKIPNHRTATHEGDKVNPVHTGAWRAPGNSTVTFARESHIDIMAHKIGMDPLEFRLRNMNDQRAIKAIKLAAEKFGWTAVKPPAGIGRGIACGEDAGTLVTVIVEVSVDTTTGHVKVNRAVVGQDMGQVVNPQGTIIQAEGCVNMGLGYALTEDIKFNWGEVHSSNFADYRITTFSMIPDKIETYMVDAMDQPPTGGGEPAIICMGGAVANAVFEACGARVTRLPVTPERILAALKRG